jgi:phenylpropionate dioxygenase-like ring-hydroxylating dioxygenase large terminal subunit
MRLEDLNVTTQPHDSHPVFNNWDVIPEAWYFAFPSRELKAGSVRRLDILMQRLAVFRTQSGTVKAVDAFCPHMGTDLSLGKVRGENLQCFFHRWEFNGEGRCRRIPSLPKSEVDQDFGLKAYPVCEKYGMIWIYAGAQPTVPVLEVPDLEGKEVEFWIGRRNFNRSHHHISMVNGLDAQHLQTVHGLSLQMTIDVNEKDEQVEFILRGPVPGMTLADRMMRTLFGSYYSYSMKYSQASVATLTILRDVHFLKKSWGWPRLHMIYAYRPVKVGLSTTQPIYVTEKRRGFLGKLRSFLYIFLTYRAYYFLKDEDDRIYDNVRFDSRRFLGVDQTVARYIRFVNALKPSRWSRKPEAEC